MCTWPSPLEPDVLQVGMERGVATRPRLGGQVEETGDRADSARGVDQQVRLLRQEAAGLLERVGGEAQPVPRAVALDAAAVGKQLCAGPHRGGAHRGVHAVAGHVVGVGRGRLADLGEAEVHVLFAAGQREAGPGLEDAVARDLLLDAEPPQEGHRGGDQGLADHQRRRVAGVEERHALAGTGQVGGQRGSRGPASDDGNRVDRIPHGANLTARAGSRNG